LKTQDGRIRSRMDVSWEHRNSDESQSALSSTKKEGSSEKYKNTFAREGKCLRSQRNVLSRSPGVLLSSPCPLGLKARTCYTWTKFLATTFKTRFEGRTFRVAKVCLSRTSKRTITRLLREIRADVFKYFFVNHWHFYDGAVSKRNIMYRCAAELEIINKIEW